MPMLERTAEALVREWLRLYKIAPTGTVVATVVGMALAATAAYFGEQNSQKQRDARRLQSSTYAVQAQALDQTRANLQSLLEFVENERKQLESSQRALQALRTEHDRLRPVLETDRKAIDALFAAQEARNQVALFTERWIGFGMGVLASLVATFVWAIGSYIVRRRRGATGDAASP